MTRRQPDLPNGFRPDERGVALLLAIIVLSTLAMIALFLGSMTAVDRRMAGDEVTQAKALHFAEAGVAEALTRISNTEGPKPTVPNAANKVVQILLANSVGTAGPDTTLLATSQPAGQWLPYSSANRGPGALTIEFVTNAARTRICRYDKTLNPPIQVYTGMAVFKITSTGTVGSVSRTIVTQVVRIPRDISPSGALVSRQPITLTGTSMACGFNHRIDTPAGAGFNGRTGGGGCNENPGANPPQWEVSTSGIPGVWSTGPVSLGGSATSYGLPAISPNNLGFNTGPWDLVNMNSASFWTWLGAPQFAMPATPSGITYLDNDGVTLNGSGSWSLNDGSGILIADGNLDLQGSWRGIIYAQGNVRLTGSAWVLGAIVSNQNSLLKVTGDATVLFSKDAIAEYVGTLVKGGSFLTLSWVES